MKSICVRLAILTVLLTLTSVPASGQSTKAPTKPPVMERPSLEQRVTALEKTLRALQSELAAMRAQFERGSPTRASTDAAGLSRNEARRLISRKLHLPAAQTTSIPRMALNRASSGSSKGGGFMPTVTICQELGASWQQVSGRVRKLQGKGLLVLGQKVESSGKCVYEYTTIALTAQALPFLVGNSDDGFALRTHTLSFGEISGIRMIEQLKIAEVQYTLLVEDVTPFAEGVSLQPVHRSATFELFDDGWRIQ